MSLYKSTGFNLAGKVYESGESLCNEDFPTPLHITACLNAGYITKISDEDVVSADFEETKEEIKEEIKEETKEELEIVEDIYESMEKEELIEELISMGKVREDFESKQAKTLRTMLRAEA